MKYSLVVKQVAGFLLSIWFISLAFPSPPLSNICLISLFVLSFFLKRTNNSKKKSSIFLGLVLLYFILCVISNLLFDNIPFNKDFTLTLYFVIIPLTFYNLSSLFTRSYVSMIQNLFCISVLIFSFIGLIKVLILVHYQIENKIYYESFSRALKIHSTYFSLIVVIAYSILLQKVLKTNLNKKEIVGYILLLLFLCAVVFILLARIGIVALIIISICGIFMNFRKLNKKIIFLLLFAIVSSISLYFITTGYSSERIKNIFTENQAGKSDLVNRIILWENAICAYNKAPSSLLGSGLNNSQELLNSCYKENNFFGYISNYNTHNQYLQTLLETGLLGFLSFIALILFLIFKFFRQKNKLALSFMLIFGLFFITESVLERQLGISVFLSFTALFVFYENKD